MSGWPRAVAVAVAAAVLLFSFLGRADLFNPDEPREAEMAREMWAGGDLAVPRLNAEPFLEKPPLFYWMVIAAYGFLGGPGEAAARLAPAVCGFLSVLLTFLLGRSLVGERGAALSALVLLTSFEFWWLARRSMIDMPLTLAVLVACLAFHRGVAPGTHRRWPWLATGSAATAAALLFKGIVGAGIPALAVGGWLAARRDRRGMLRLLPWGLLSLLPVAAWTVILHARLGEAATREFVVVNNVLRFVGGAGKGHDNPPYYYVPTFLAEFLPWSVVLPVAIAAAWRAWRRREDGAPEDAVPEGRAREYGAREGAAQGGGAMEDGACMGGGREGGAAAEPLAFLLAWFILPFVVLSIASTKRGIYLVPIYPAAALLIGWWLARPAGVAETRAPQPGPDTTGAQGAPTAPVGQGGEPGAPAGRADRIARVLLFAVLLVMSAAGVGALVLALPEAWLSAAGVAAILGGLGAMAFRALRRGDGGRLATLTASGCGVLYLALAFFVIPEVVGRVASARPVAAVLKELAGAGDRVALYRFKQGMLGGHLFYSGRTYPNLRRVEDLAAHLRPLPGAAPEGPAALALLREDVYRDVAPVLGFPTTVARRFDPGAPVPERERRPLVLIVAAGPAPAAAPAPEAASPPKPAPARGLEPAPGDGP